jgi:hypothetical protein
MKYLEQNDENDWIDRRDELGAKRIIYTTNAIEGFNR